MARIRSFGTRIWVNGIAVGGWKDLSPTTREAAIIDVTCQDSGDNSREFIAGLIDNGTLEIDGLFDFDDLGQAEIRDNIDTEMPVHVAFSDGSGYTFTGIPKSFGEGGPLDDAVPFSASIQITGEVEPFGPSLTTTGTLTHDGVVTVTVPAVSFSDLTNDRPAYLGSSGSKAAVIEWSGSQWVLTLTSVSPNYTAIWTSTANVSTPDQVTALYPGAWHTTNNPNGWKPTAPATGTPAIS